MSSGVTLNAATRQNLLSLQGTAELVATTQNRLATGKKVNSALDNPTNFFTASALTNRSSNLSSLLDGIGNGIQTIQAANTGLTKLQSLTNQLKSTAQQALASPNAFTTKATSTSAVLSGATAANLVSSGATVALANNAVGTLTGSAAPTAPVAAALTGSIDYKPTSSATKLSGGVYTPTVATVAKATGTAFTAPANAVAGAAIGGTYSGSTGTLSIKSGTNATITVNTLVAGDTIDQAVAKIQTALTNAGSTVTVAKGAAGSANDGKIVFTGATNGDALNVQGSNANTGFGTDAASSVTSTGQAAAEQQILTINGANITIRGGNVGDTAATVLANAATAINNANTGATATGVSAAVGLGADAGKLVLTGKADGTNFTAQGSANNTLGFAANAAPTANGSPAASQTLTINGTQISIAGGATQAQAMAAINAQTGVTGVTAAQDPSNPSKIALTGKSDGSSFTVSASNAASSGFAAATVTSSIAATVVGGAYSADGIRATATGTPFTLPANAVAATVTGTAFTAPANAVAATVTGTALTLPANAVRGTAVGAAYSQPANGSTLAIKSGTGAAINVTFNDGTGGTTDNSSTIDKAVAAIQTALTNAGSTVTVAKGAAGSANDGKIVFSGATNGDSLNVQGSNANIGFGTNAGSSVNSTGQSAATSSTFTFGTGGTAKTVTVTGGLAGSTAKTLADVRDAINLETSAATNPTGVTATINAAGTGLTLTGASNGSAFTVTGGANTGFNTSATTVNGTVAETQTLTFGTGVTANTVTISGGNAGSTLKTVTDVMNLINAQTNAATNPTGVTATINAAGTGLVLSGPTNGGNFTIQGSSANTGFGTASNTVSNGTAAQTQTLTINGTAVTIRGGNAGDTATTAGNAAAAAINAATGTTGVSAQALGGSFVLTGDNTGANFTVVGGVNNTLGFASGVGTTTTNGAPPAAQTLTLNGTAITLAAGTTLANAVTAINAQTATTGVTASVDPTTGHLALTGKADGTSFTVASSNPAANGFGALPTTINGTAGASQTLTVNNTAITIPASASLDDAIKAINLQSGTTGVTASKDTSNGGNKLVLSGPSDGSSFTVQGSAGNTLGVATTANKIAGTLDPAPTSLVTALGFAAGDNFSVNGQIVTLAANDTITSLVQKVGAATNGAVTASYDTTTNKFSFTAVDPNTAVTLGDGSTATSKVANLGFTSTAFAAGLGATGSRSALQGQSITVQVGSGANVSTTSLTFGSGVGQVSTLAQLNAMLASANAQATLDASTGKLSITTTNDMGAENLSITASGTGNPFTTGTISAQIGGDGATNRNNLVTTYNNLLNQLDQLASDSGYNGINLLNGDNMKLDFNEKGTSSMLIEGSSISSSRLGLSVIGQSTFQESSSINKLISQINSATEMLKSRASSLGSSLTVVQNRQDFSKQLINILDTGAANLTNADLNEEAANSQALSTRQSLGISALSLANQAQQGILQLLR